MEDSIVLSLGATHSFPLDEVREYLSAETVRDVLTQALLDAPMFAARWRWVTTIALAVRRNRNGQRIAPQLQRMDAEDLIAVVFPDQLACLENIQGAREIPDHPLVAQTLEDCLHEAMDVEGLIRLLRNIESGEVNVVTRELTMPSPLAGEILTARPYAFLDDAPAEERRTSAVMARSFMDPETAASLAMLDPDAIASVQAEAWPEARDADEMHDALVVYGGFSEREIDSEPKWRPWCERLAADGRVCQLTFGGAQVWVATERLHQWLALHPQAVLRPATSTLQAVAADPAPDLADLLSSRLECVGPITESELADHFGVAAAHIRVALLQLQHQGSAMCGKYAGDREQWCDRRLLARVHRYTVERLRKEIEPVSATQYMRFLCDWTRLSVRKQGEGVDALHAVLSQLEGFSAPVAAWESALLPSRLRKYSPQWLDQLCLSGGQR